MGLNAEGNKALLAGYEVVFYFHELTHSFFFSIFLKVFRN